jgi:hypothetical protein
MPMVISSTILGLMEILIFAVGENVGFVAFFKSIWGRDRVIKPIYIP